MKKSLCFLILLISFLGHSEKAFSQYSDVFPLRWNTLYPYNYRHSFGTVFPFRLYYTSIEIISGGQHSYLSNIDCNVGNITNRCSFYVNFCFEEQGVYHTVVRFSGNEVSNAGNGDIIGEAYTYDRDFTVDVQEGGSNPGHCAGFIPTPDPGGGGGGPPPPSPTPVPTPTPRSLSLIVASLDDSEQVLSESLSIASSNSTVDVILGSYAKIYLMSSDGALKSASYKLNSPPNFNQEIGEVDSNKSLYADRVALLFNEGAEEGEQKLVPVHLGNQTLTITPSDSEYPAFNISLNVTPPLKIGEVHNELDTLIIKFAHSRGVPPQLIKGQIAHESANRFDPNSFRYEPRVWDLRRGQEGGLWEKDLYKRYRLGSSLNSQLTNMLYPRKIYKTQMNGVTVNIPDNYETAVLPGKYTPLTAQNMMISNNAVQNWDNLKTAVILEIDGDSIVSNFVRVNPSYKQYDFVAQTILSSSYGLLQIMYPTAVTNCAFKNQDGSGRRPVELFDAGENVSCGSSYLVQLYVQANKNEGKNKLSKIKDFLSFKMAFKTALQKYNGAYMDLINDDSSYSSMVWKKTINFWPIASTER